jgi:hypothetical protein
MNKYYDIINELPSDEYPPSESDLQISNMLFADNIVKENESSVFLEIIDPIIVGVIFFIFSLPCIDVFISGQTGEGMKLFIKTLFVIILFWIIKKIKNKL